MTKNTERDKEIVRLYSTGLTGREIALQFRLTPSRVYGILTLARIHAERRPLETTEPAQLIAHYGDPRLVPIDALDTLSVRAYNCCKNLNIATLGQLAIYPDSQILATKNLGATTLHELKTHLATFGLSFAPEPPAGTF